MVRTALPPALTATRVLAILRGHATEAARDIATALVGADLGTVEVTLNSPDAYTTIAALVRDGLPLVGAGTVLTLDDAKRAVDAGAGLLVSPHTDVDLIGWAADQRVPSLPGAMTPSEVYAAWDAGATAIKLFPAGSLGPQYLRELRGPFGDIPVIPTGGVTADTAAAWMGAGAAALGVGSWLTGVPAHVASRAAALRHAVHGREDQ
jgi:2-dehydro-3-deoxyphosphogluconate aldolase/(4S)-4-hydroxy-2-oxoglutarate aldolase